MGQFLDVMVVLRGYARHRPISQMPVPFNLQCLLGIAYQLAAWLRCLVLVGHVIPPAAAKFRVFRITNPDDLGFAGDGRECLLFLASLVAKFEHERSVSNHATACPGSKNSMLCPSSVPPLPALWIPCHSDGPADGCIAKLKSDHQMSVGEGFEPLAAARGAP